MPGQEYELGTYVGKFRFDLPESEKRKMDVMAQRSGQMDRFYESFSHSGAAMAATIGAFGALASGGQGMQSVLGAMSTLGSAMLDLVTLPLIPLMMPLMHAMIGVVQDLAGARNGPGGIMGALQNPDFWSEHVIKPLGNALGGLWDALKPLLDKAGNYLVGLLRPIGAEIGGAFVAVVGAWLVMQAIPMMMMASAGGGVGSLAFAAGVGSTGLGLGALAGGLTYAATGSASAGLGVGLGVAAGVIAAGAGVAFLPAIAIGGAVAVGGYFAGKALGMT